MNEVSHWVKGRLSEPSTYAAASVAAIGGWVLTAQMSWIWVALALAAVAVVMHEKAEAMDLYGSRSFFNQRLLATGRGSFGSGSGRREAFFQCQRTPQRCR